MPTVTWTDDFTHDYFTDGTYSLATYLVIPNEYYFQDGQLMIGASPDEGGGGLNWLDPRPQITPADTVTVWVEVANFTQDSNQLTIYTGIMTPFESDAVNVGANGGLLYNTSVDTVLNTVFTSVPLAAQSTGRYSSELDPDGNLTVTVPQPDGPASVTGLAASDPETLASYYATGLYPCVLLNNGDGADPSAGNPNLALSAWGYTISSPDPASGTVATGPQATGVVAL
jgi:hypothetical protein